MVDTAQSQAETIDATASGTNNLDTTGYFGSSFLKRLQDKVPELAQWYLPGTRAETVVLGAGMVALGGARALGYSPVPEGLEADVATMLGPTTAYFAARRFLPDTTRTTGTAWEVGSDVGTKGGFVAAAKSMITDDAFMENLRTSSGLGAIEVIATAGSRRSPYVAIGSVLGGVGMVAINTAKNAVRAVSRAAYGAALGSSAYIQSFALVATATGL